MYQVHYSLVGKKLKVEKYPKLFVAEEKNSRQTLGNLGISELQDMINK